MKREQSITELQKYFDIRELVSRDVYARFGQTAWRFFDTELIETLLALRTKILCVPLTCNNWHTGGTYTQRGLRVNTSPLVADKTERNVLYISAHLLGKGVDLSSRKMTADEMRTAIQAQQSKLPYKVRIEKAENAPSWLHIDIMHSGAAQKIEWFQAVQNDITFCNGYKEKSLCPLCQRCFRFIHNGKELPERVFVFHQAPFERLEETDRATCKYYFEK